MPEIEAPRKLHLPSPRQLMAIRAYEGLSQTQFAKEAGVSLSTLTDFEKNHRTIGQTTLYAMAKALFEKGVKFKNGNLVLPE